MAWFQCIGERLVDPTAASLLLVDEVKVTRRSALQQIARQGGWMTEPAGVDGAFDDCLRGCGSISATLEEFRHARKVLGDPPVVRVRHRLAKKGICPCCGVDCTEVS